MTPTDDLIRQLESHAHEASQRGDQALALKLHEAAGRVRELEAKVELLRKACKSGVHLFEQGCVDRGYKDKRNWIDDVRDELDDAIFATSPTPATTKG